MNYIIQNPIGNVYALDGITKEAEIRTADIKITSITLTTTDINIIIGETKNLTAIIQPANASNKNVIWTTSNSNIATVDNSGLVIGKTSGTITIMATTQDGNYTDTSNVVVSAPIVFTNQSFNYTKSYQTFIAQVAGKYKLEVWGAKGGDGYGFWGTPNISEGGKGGYSYGEINLIVGETLYIYIGGQGFRDLSGINGGWNGGGNTTGYTASYPTGTNIAAGGGGATDIRTVGGNWSDSASLSNRVIVGAGGGGGGNGEYNRRGGAGGGLNGENGFSYNAIRSIGGTQISGYSLGAGQSGLDYCGGGGGGYYGGFAPYPNNHGGGGGSSYIGSLLNAGTTAGSNVGVGKATITYVGK